MALRRDLWHSRQVLHVLLLSVIALLSLTEVACGGRAVAGAGRPRPTSAMTSRDLALFDDGVDFVGDASGFGGTWVQTWQGDLDQRISRADVVAVVGVASLSLSEQVAEGAAKFVLTPEADQVLKGDWPPGEPLVSVQGTEGFSSLQRGGDRVLQGSYLMFVKWADEPDGTVSPKWHLSRAQDAMIERVSRRFGRDEEGRKIVVTHTN